jgi:hypothetical protein
MLPAIEQLLIIDDDDGLISSLLLASLVSVYASVGQLHKSGLIDASKSIDSLRAIMTTVNVGNNRRRKSTIYRNINDHDSMVLLQSTAVMYQMEILFDGANRSMIVASWIEYWLQLASKSINLLCLNVCGAAMTIASDETHIDLCIRLAVHIVTVQPTMVSNYGEHLHNLVFLRQMICCY